MTKTSKNFGGTSWIIRRVYDVVTDQKYIGKIIHKGIAYDAEHKVIVSQMQFAAAQKMLAKTKTCTHEHQKQRFALLQRMREPDHAGLDPKRWPRVSVLHLFTKKSLEV